MSVAHPRLAPPLSLGHPAVLDRRVRELAIVALTSVIPLGIGLAVAIAVPKPNILAAVGVIVGAVGVVALMASRRLEVTVTVVAVYLGMIAGPVKLLGGTGPVAAALQDVVIVAVALGAILRPLIKRQRMTLPPLSGWVLGFVVLVLAEAFNPQTEGFLHFLGGLRQQLQYAPFFFFGYVLVRSKVRFRKLFVVFGVMALANGIVATYQTQLSPAQLASWGPGYHERIYGVIVEGKARGGGRVFSSEGVGHVRPPALGSDAGFGGGVGMIALPGTLALLALWRLRRRWIGVVLCFGAMVAVVTCLGRLQVVGAVIAVAAFAALTSMLGRHMTRPVATLLGVGILALPAGALFIEAEGSGTFKRYESIAPGAAVSTTTQHKSQTLELLPHQIAVAPFGVGLGSVGAVSGFGGRSTDRLEGHGVNAETQFNLMADELGLPGMLLWTAWMLYLIALAVRGLRRIPDPELRLSLAAITAPLIALLFMAHSGPLTQAPAAGPYMFFAAGIIAYWFAGPGRALEAARPPRSNMTVDASAIAPGSIA
jgi:hypothetical protein